MYTRTTVYGGMKRGECTCLSGGIESQHEEAHFSRSEDLAHDLGDLSAHVGGLSRSWRAGVGNASWIVEVPSDDHKAVLSAPGLLLRSKEEALLENGGGSMGKEVEVHRGMVDGLG